MNEKNDIHAIRVRMFITAIVVCAILAVSIFSFTKAYYNLTQAVQKERTAYITEVAAQVMDKIHSSKIRHAKEIQTNARYVEMIRPGTFAPLDSLFKDADPVKYLFVSTDGDIRQSNGRSVFLGDKNFIGNIKAGDSVLTAFSTIGQDQDYLLFGEAISPQHISGEVYTAIIMAIPTQEICKNLSISLFNGNAAAYLISEGGSIEMRPNSDDLKFNGYNLFASIAAAGANPDELNLFEQAMRNHTKNSQVIHIQDEVWLFCFQKSEDLSKALVVAIPLALTAKATYSGISRTIFFAALVMFLFAVLLILIYHYFSLLDKKRTESVAAITAQSNFLSKISHDIRTPLNTVVGTLELAKQQELPPVTMDYIQKAETATGYLLELINDVLDMRKIDSGKMTLAQDPLSLDDVISDIDTMIRPTANAKNISFVISIDPPLESDYLGDEIRLKQILMNLLSNAVKFTPDRGRVTLQVAHRPLTGDTDEITFTAGDTGIGMSDAFRKRIFKPFEQEHSSYTANTSGSGLGLSIVKTLVEMMKGNIEVRSEQGKGSSFTIRLPLQKVPRTEKHAQKNAEILKFNGERVLLVEDNLINQQLAANLLSSGLKLSIDTASNGKEAVDSFTNAPAGTYSAILMDVKMPVMDGLDATRTIRKSKHPDAKRIPIFALSANAFAEDVKESLDAGMNGHFTKPLNMQAIARGLHEYLGKENQ